MQPDDSDWEGEMQATGIEIEWDGEHLPKELAQLPPGRYHVLLVDEDFELTEEEDAGIQAALDEAEAGLGLPLEDVIREIRARHRRA
jgi:hypothetical protein